MASASAHSRPRAVPGTTAPTSHGTAETRNQKKKRPAKTLLPSWLVWLLLFAILTLLFWMEPEALGWFARGWVLFLLGYLAGARGHYVMAGTPEQVADLIEDWFSDGAADGFNVMPPLLPAQLDTFSAEVIPLLQRRGLFRTAYSGTTLREHYGLPWPSSWFDDPTQKVEVREAVAGV